MLDPKLQNILVDSLDENCIVVFDEAHSIDNSCIEAFSLNINQKVIEEASVNLDYLKQSFKDTKETAPELIKNEYEALTSK